MQYLFKVCLHLLQHPIFFSAQRLFLAAREVLDILFIHNLLAANLFAFLPELLPIKEGVVSVPQRRQDSSFLRGS